VYLDGVFVQTIDLANATAIYKQNVWSTGNVSAGPHAVKIAWYAKNQAGKYITLDAVDVVGTLTSPPPAVTGIKVASGPTTGGNPVVITGANFTGASGASAVTFGGTNAASYTVDSATQITAVAPAHAAGTVQVKVTTLGGSTPEVSTDDYTYATPPPTSRYEQTDSRLVYAGTWYPFSTSGPSGGSYKRASTAGASVTIKFTGTYLAWIATAGTTLSKAYVSLDGGTAQSINLARSAVAYQQNVWNTGIFATAGPHTVKIWWDTSNAAGKFISIDAVDVAGTLM
jgi:hypothetical protein